MISNFYIKTFFTKS